MKLINITTKIILLTILSINADNIIEQNLELNTETLDLPIGTHNKVKIFVGSGLKDQEGQETMVDFIFGRSQTSLGDAERAKWGV